MVIDTFVHKYRQGGCFAMALALSELTGFPVRCIDYGGCTHAFVQSPAGDVLDIHGKQSWAEFIAFLIRENCLPPHAVHPGIIVPEPLPEAGEEPASWRHFGYRPASRAAVIAAKKVARTHPNLFGVL